MPTNSMFAAIIDLLTAQYNELLPAGVALNVRFTINGMCAKNNTIYMWCEQAIIE